MKHYKMAASTSTSMMSVKEDDRFLPGKFKYNGREWTTLSLCGVGTFSSCYHVCNDEGKRLAMKVYKKEAKYTTAFANELEIFSILDDGLQSQKGLVSYFVKYIGSFTLLDHNCILMDLLGCNLKEILLKHDVKGFSTYLIKKILRDLGSALVFLEGLGLVHGDIKPTNILWNMILNCFQIIDFGLSFKVGKQPNQALQSPGFQAPEVLQWNREVTEARLLKFQDTGYFLNSSIDMWSLGCVTLYVSTGQQLYPKDHAQQLPLLCSNCKSKSGSCNNALKSKTVMLLVRNVLRTDDFENLTNILSGLLQCDPGNRLPPQELLKHPFFNENNNSEPSITDLVILPTKILRLMNMFETSDEDEMEDILCDIKQKCEEFGSVVSITAEKDSLHNQEYHVYVEFKNAEDCESAQRLLTGRYFNNRLVVTTFFPVRDFLERYFY